MTLQQLSQEMLTAVNQEMRSVLRFDEAKSNTFYGMLHYHMGWTDANLNPVNVKSGKQIRPLLLLLACQAAGGDWRQAVPAAAAVELLHNFSLIHDDIEDDSPMRRGRPTLWKIWGMEQAINSGDALFALSHLALMRLTERGVGAKTAVYALRRFDETCVALTQGQYRDMDFETRNAVGVNEYVEMITGKTAVLLSLCAELGALIAGAAPEAIGRYAIFGRDLGLAFQIKDDILGIWGDETLTGKSAASDIATKKKTLPVLYGLEKSEALRRLYANGDGGDDFVQQAIALLTKKNARQYAEKEARRYSEHALENLTAVNPAGNAALTQLAHKLLDRQL